MADEWKSEALCRRFLDSRGDPDSLDPIDVLRRREALEIWFPESRDRPVIARRYCANCPVATECLREALAGTRDRAGIFAGTSEKQRRTLRRRPDREAAIGEFVEALHRAFIPRPGAALMAASFRHGTPEAFRFGCRCPLCCAANWNGMALCMAPTRGRDRCRKARVKGHLFCRWHLPGEQVGEELSA